MFDLRIPMLAALTFAAFTGSPASAESDGMSETQLQELLSDGQMIQLGGPGEGYSGSLQLNADGTGSGKVETDSGNTITLNGTWEIQGNKFCRTWSEIDDGNQVCETWVPSAANKVEVFRDGQKIGVNSW